MAFAPVSHNWLAAAVISMVLFIVIPAPKASAGTIIRCLLQALGKKADDRSVHEYQFPSRISAFRAAKQDAGIPFALEPFAVQRVPLRDLSGKLVRRNGRVVNFREYHYRKTDGRIVVVQEHSWGHRNSPDGKGEQGPHFNVRLGLDPHLTYPGALDHYHYQDRRMSPR
jgi:hypothetical protein